jgi:hypothetical protein
VEIKARGIDILLIKFLDSYFQIDASDFRYGKNSVNLSLSNLALPEHINIKIDKLTLKQHLIISMDRLVTKSKRIHINYAGVKDLEYFLSNRIVSDKNKVKVRGALSLINDIKAIETEKISKKMIKDNYLKVRLIPPNNDVILLEPEIKFRVVQQKLISKTISLIPIKFPQNKKITLIPQKVTVMVRGPQNIIEKLDNTSVKAYIPEKDLNKTGFVNVKFITPKGVSVIDYTPRKIQIMKNE